MRGACPGRMPRYPFLPGICISSAWSRTTIFSGVTISSWKESAIRIYCRFLCRRFHLLCSFCHFVNRTLHVEGLLRDVVVLPFDDAAEAFHCVFDLDVTARRTGELLCHEERLRQELLHLAGAGDRDLLIFAQFVDTQDG